MNFIKIWKICNLSSIVLVFLFFLSGLYDERWTGSSTLQYYVAWVCFPFIVLTILMPIAYLVVNRHMLDGKDMLLCVFYTVVCPYLGSFILYYRLSRHRTLKKQ